MNIRASLMTTTRPILMSPPNDGGGGEGPADGGQAAGADGAQAGGAEAAGAGESGGDKPWYEAAGLPEDLLKSSLVLRSKTLVDALTAGNAAEKRLGVPANEMIRLPTKPDDVEGLKAVYKALGAPDTPEGYKIDLKDATDADKAVVGDFAKFMHEKGPFPPAALAAAAEFWHGKVIEQAAAEQAEAEAAQKASEAALRQEWGGAYDQRKMEIGKLLTDLGGEALAKELNADAVLGNSPELAKMLAKIVDLRAESGPTQDGQNADVGKRQLTPGQARVNLAALEGDAEKMEALMDKTHRLHASVLAERNALLAAAHPTTQPKS